MQTAFKLEEDYLMKHPKGLLSRNFSPMCELQTLQTSQATQENRFGRIRRKIISK
jgi:hypothetical protein